MPIGGVYESIRLEFGKKITFMDLIDAEKRVVGHMEIQKLGRLLDKLLACRRPTGGAPAFGSAYISDPDLLESPATPPDSLPASRDLQKVMELLREAVSLLSRRDRLLLRMRFERGENARRIGELLGFRDVKHVYRRLDRLYGDLASILEEKGMSAETCRYLARDMDTLFSMADMWCDRENPN